MDELVCLILGPSRKAIGNDIVEAMNLVDVNEPPLHVMDGKKLTTIISIQIANTRSREDVKIIARMGDDLKMQRGSPLVCLLQKKKTSMLHVIIFTFVFVLLVLFNTHGHLHLY